MSRLLDLESGQLSARERPRLSDGRKKQTRKKNAVAAVSQWKNRALCVKILRFCSARRSEEEDGEREIVCVREKWPGQQEQEAPPVKFGENSHRRSWKKVSLECGISKNYQTNNNG